MNQFDRIKVNPPQFILANPNDEFNAPIFIGGPDRCGKTTLRSFLVSHPSISIPLVGSNMWTFFYNRFGDLSRPSNFERCLAAMLNYKHVAFLNPDPERVRDEFYAGNQTYARLFGLIQSHYAEQHGKPRWGDQTGLIERYADPIFSAYPEARMIQMIRDPRDRLEAQLSRYPKGRGKAGGAAARWLYAAILAQRNLRRYPRQFMVVRFESLVEDPETVIKSVCRFIGEDYDPEMLTMSGAPIFKQKLTESEFYDPSGSLLSRNYLGRYRIRLSDDDIRFMQLVTKRQMAVNGYPMESLDNSVRKLLKFNLYTLPLNIVKMSAWLMREFLQQSAPRWIKRKPGSHMDLSEQQDARSAPTSSVSPVSRTASRGPVFIGGASRSGKTYMRLMLGSLPGLAVSRRTRLWTNFYNRYGDLSKDENLDRCLAELEKKKHVQLLLPDMNSIRQQFRQGPPTYPHLFDQLHRAYARKVGKQRWADQTEGIERFAELILESYPDARFIHMVRDPRDRFEAILARDLGAHNRLGVESARWNQSWDLGRDLQARFPERYRIIKYEDMVREPAEVMASVCDFIGEEFDPRIVSLRYVARFKDHDVNNSQGSPLSESFIGRYKTGLTASQTRFIQAAAGYRLAAAEYYVDKTASHRFASLRFYLGYSLFYTLQMKMAYVLDRQRLHWRLRQQPVLISR